MLIGEDECFYQFVWPSSEACPKTGMSGGAIFLIVYGLVAGTGRACDGAAQSLTNGGWRHGSFAKCAY